ncbi:hypothetical protein INS49_010536 [Diaporthe citri]|uniref:uncharacterized protein n=1 Tax=Diaporthe citri TaxID=83186 RepID=UPI001C7F5F16|nr:uncharacterized protein INS49_010536 [Diaporthe citri]KAG6362306.1 hypothetical protein INS49_010536 [Diaporthe citri]
MLPSQKDILFSGDVFVRDDGHVDRDFETQHLGCFTGGMFLLGGQTFGIADHVRTGLAYSAIKDVRVMDETEKEDSMELDSIIENPIFIRPEHVAAEPTKLIAKKRGMSFSGGDITVWSKDSEADAESHDDNDKPPPSYICKGKAASWTQKRTVSDAAGLALFEICRKSTGVTWFARVPGHDSQAGDRPLVTLAMERSAFHDKFDVCVHGGNGNDLRLKVRGQDTWKLRTNVYWGDKVVMTTKRQGKLDIYVPGKSLDMKKSSSTGVATGAAIGAGAGAAGGAAA